MTLHLAIIPRRNRVLGIRRIRITHTVKRKTRGRPKKAETTKKKGKETTKKATEEVASKKSKAGGKGEKDESGEESSDEEDEDRPLAATGKKGQAKGGKKQLPRKPLLVLFSLTSKSFVFLGGKRGKKKAKFVLDPNRCPFINDDGQRLDVPLRTCSVCKNFVYCNSHMTKKVVEKKNVVMCPTC